MVASLLIFGCASAPRSTGPTLDSVPLPTYEGGTTYIYSDGKWETVLDSSSEVVTWRDYRNYISSGSRDFTRRRTKWETKTRQGTRQFGPRRDLIGKSALTVWPLRVGNIANYSETGTWFDKDGVSSTYHSEWSCEVPGTEQVSVMAGEFDTWKIVCKRYRLSKSKSRSNIREVTAWYFSQKVGHYVLTTSKYYYDKKPRRRELLAVLPSLDGISPDARLKMERSFQQALEIKKSGDSMPWSSQQSKIFGETIPVNTFKTADGKYCRRYVQKLELPGRRRTYYGLAVRDADGVWKVPRR